MQVCVLLLDTEGENDVDTSQMQDMKIYTLTAMMSSMLVRYWMFCYCFNFKAKLCADLQCHEAVWS